MGKRNAICITLILVFMFNFNITTCEIEHTDHAYRKLEVQDVKTVNLNTSNLTDEERDYICRIVYAEAGGEGLIGQTLIAECIYNSSQISNKDPISTIKCHGYTTPAKTYTEETEKAVKMVFDEGYRNTDEPIQYFYASDKVNSRWHEKQTFVLQYNTTRFFK